MPSATLPRSPVVPAPPTAAAAPPAGETDKQREKREKLEAWKRAQAAKKAAQERVKDLGIGGEAVAEKPAAPVSKGIKLPGTSSVLCTRK